MIIFKLTIISIRAMLPLTTQLWPEFFIPSFVNVSTGKVVFHEHFLFFEFGLKVNPWHSFLQLQNFLQFTKFSTSNWVSKLSFQSFLVSPLHIAPTASSKPIYFRYDIELLVVEILVFHCCNIIVWFKYSFNLPSSR